MNKQELEIRFRNQRSNMFTIVLNDNELHLFQNAENIIKVFTSDNTKYVRFIAAILHDKDKDEHGQYKTKHYHVVVQFECNYRIGTVINFISDSFKCNENQITIDKCNNLCAQTRYLIHLDDGDKAQYFPFDVCTNDKDTLNRFLKTEIITNITQLISVVRSYHYDLEEIMMNISNYDKWRRYINDLIINHNRRRI